MRSTQLIMLFLVLLVGCAKSSDDTTLTTSKVDVVIGAQGVATTRTAIDGDGESVTWCVGDQVAVWADGVDDSDSNLVGEMFQLNYYGSDYGTAEFSSAIDPMNDEQEYTYSAFYPYQSTISGKVVSYTIPAAQSGEYDGDVDFRVASGVQGGALNSSVMNNAALKFESITHALKITIPEGHNNAGVPIKKLTMTFPMEVVGTMSYDMSTMTQSLSGDGGNTLTFDFSADPIEEGDDFWAFIKPSSGVTGDIVVNGLGIDANGNDVFTEDYIISIEEARDFEAGYYTLVGAEIGEVLESTVIQIKIGENNLGEELTNIIFTAPAGAIFSESGSNVANITNNGTGVYQVSYITDFYGDKFTGSIDVQYESEHTLFATDDITLSAVTENEVNSLSYNVPYLLSEDFSSISNFSYHDCAGVGEWDSDAAEGDTGYDLSGSDYGSLSTSGWTGNRCGGAAGKAIRLTSRYEYGAWVTSHLESRLDSPTFAKLKDGKTPTVLVKFNYKSARYSRYYAKDGGNSGWPFYTSTYSYIVGGTGVGQYNVGSTTTSGGIDGDDDISSKYYSSYQTLPNTAGGDLSDPGDCGASEHNVTGAADPSNFTNITTPGSFTISNATNSTRASWRVTNSMDNDPFTGANGNFWMYLDDITIEISNE